MLATMLRAAAGGDSEAVSVVSPAHPNLRLLATMNGITGAALIDQSGHISEGVITGAAVVSGEIGDALSYDGTDYVEFQSDSKSALAFIHKTGVFHIATWVNIATPNSGNTQGFFGSAGPSAYKGFWFGCDDSSGNNKVLRLVINKGVNGSDVVDMVSANSAVPDDGGWHLFEAWGDGDNAYISIDGETVKTASLSAVGSGDMTYPVVFGGVNGANKTRLLTGRQDFTAFYNRPLAEAERAEIYNLV